MKILLLNLLTIISTFAGAAQLSFSPESIDIVGKPSDDIIIVPSALTNSGTEDVVFYWKVEKDAAFPSEWQTQICDFRLCYGEDVDFSSPELPNTIKAGETMDMKVYLLPNGTEGESSLDLTLYSDTEFKDELITLKTASMSISNTTSIFSQEEKELIVYPNPTSDYFQVGNDTKVKKIVVYNIVGKEIKRFNHIPGRQHSVESLRNGLYLIRLFDGNGEIIKALRLSKR
ncbi:MAG: T9SS type A sorting domain-containing protein [Saprospiraceae bacterium]|nr:T9SS type A sorting domain-containing protein [Saprospiraceae bacterium]